MLALSSRHHEVNPKQLSELSYKVSRGKLRIEAYLTIISHMGCLGGVIINFFGGLKPIVVAMMSTL